MKVIFCNHSDDKFQALKQALYPDIEKAPMPEPLNDFLDSCIVVEHKGKAVCRAALYKNTNLTLNGKKLMAVGGFESYDNPQALQLMFEAISAYTLEKGYNGLIGPMNGSTWHHYRFNENVEGLFLTESFHHRYYPELWEKAGFKKSAGYYSSISENIAEVKFQLPALNPKIKIRNIDLEDYDKELERLYHFCIDAFADNHLFTPISLEAFTKLYQLLKPLLDARLIYIAEADGSMCGLVFGLPDLYAKNRKRAIIKTLARHPSEAFRGLGHQLSMMFYKNAQQLGYQDLIHAFMLDEGNAKEVSAAFYGKPFHRYSLFTKWL